MFICLFGFVSSPPQRLCFRHTEQRDVSRKDCTQCGCGIILQAFLCLNYLLHILQNSPWIVISFKRSLWVSNGLSGGSDGKESACNAGDWGLIPGLGRSPEEGNGYPLQYSSLESSMDRRAWRATFHGVTNSQTRLSDHHSTFSAQVVLYAHLPWPLSCDIMVSLYSPV